MVKNPSGQYVIPVGTFVYVTEDDAFVPDDPWTHPVQLGMTITRLGWEAEVGDKPFYGKVVNIITRKWFGLVKLKEPIYVVDLGLYHSVDGLIYTKNPQLKKPS